MDFYNYKIELPISKKVFSFRTLSTREQIALLKANLSFPESKENYFDYNEFVAQTISNCILNKDEFLNLNIIDYVLLVTKIRILSVGNIIELITESENTEFKKSKIKLNLNVFLKNLYEASIGILENNIVNHNNLTLKINWPDLNSIKIFQTIINQENNDYDIFLKSFYEFIEYVSINDDIFYLRNVDSEAKEKIVNKLPVSLIDKTQKLIIEHLKNLTNADLWALTTFKSYTFNFYNLSFIDFIRLFFSNDLQNIYNEICYMANRGLTPEYLLNLSPTDRRMHLNLINDQIKQENEGGKTDSEGVTDDLTKLALEFGDVPP